MEATVGVCGNRAVMSLRGRFDFTAQGEYRDALERLMHHETVQDYEVDLAGVNYLDSSALGMLLVLRDRARRAGKDVTLSGAQGNVRQVLDIASFSRLFALR